MEKWQAPKLSVDQSTATEEDVSGQAQQIDGEEADYHHLLGYWNVTIKTPIAELNIEYHFYEKTNKYMELLLIKVIKIIFLNLTIFKSIK